MFPVRAGIPDFAPELELSTGRAQRLMESRFVVRGYERAIRPAFTRLGSSIRYEDEEAFLHKRFRPAPGPLLDLACGTGRYGRFLAAMTGEPGEIVGLDLSRLMLARAVTVAPPGARFARGSAQALPFADASFGGVVCFGALHLFPDPPAALAEIARVLAPGGAFACLTTERSRGKVGGMFQRAELESALTAVGLYIDEVEEHGMVLLLAAHRGERVIMPDRGARPRGR